MRGQKLTGMTYLQRLTNMNDVLVAAHMMEAEGQGAEITNLGWGQGEDFIESKTDQGVLISRYAKGETTHEWLPYNRCVLCNDLIYGYGNNPAPVAKEGVCCDGCNATKVLPARLQRAYDRA